MLWAAVFAFTIAYAEGWGASTAQFKDAWNPYPVRPGRSFNILNFGAVGDNKTLNHEAIQRAVSAAAASGGGYVVVPPGIFLTGSVSLVSRVYLVLEAGSVLQGTSDPRAYNRDWDFWHIVQGVNVSNTGIISPRWDAPGGELRGAMWQMIASYNATTGYTQVEWKGVDGCDGECRPKNLAFIDAENVTVAGVKVADSSDWTQLFRRCRNVLEDRVVVTGDLQWGNNDGLDVESCSNFTLTNSVFETGDDALAFRSGNCNKLRTPWPRSPDGAIQPLSRVRVRNVTLTSSSAAIKVEALFQKDHGDVSDMLFEDVRIVRSNRGIGVWQRVGNGTLDGLVFRNISIETNYVPMPQFWGSGDPIVVTSIPSDDASAQAGLKGIHNVTFENIAARSEQGALFAALGRASVAGVVLKNVSITIEKISPYAKNASWEDPSSRAVHDFRPLSGPAAAALTPTEPRAPVDGIFLAGNAEVALHDVAVAFKRPYRTQWSLRCLNASGSAIVKGRLSHCEN